MSYDVKLADRIREIIAAKDKNVEEKKMFGGLCFIVNEKMCVCVKNDKVMLRLDPGKFEEFIENQGCKPMDMGGKIMKGFLFVDAEMLTTKKKLEYWLKQALEYNVIAKATKKKKN